jgi:hypothetical protein
MSQVLASDVGALNNQPVNPNYLSICKFKFIIPKIPTCNYFVQEVTLPGIRIPSTIQQTPFQNLPLPGNKVMFDNLLISFIVDEDLRNYFEIVDWMFGLAQIKDFKRYASLKNEKTQLNSEFGGLWDDAILFSLSSESNPNVNIKFRDCYPVGLSPITYRANVGEDQMIVANVSFDFAYFEMERPVVQ